MRPWRHARRPRPRAGLRSAPPDQPPPGARRDARRPRLGRGRRVRRLRLARDGRRDRAPATRSPRRPPARSPATAPTARTSSPRAASSAQDITKSVGDASGVAEGVPDDDQPQAARRRRWRRAARGRRGVPAGTATARAGTRSTTSRSRARTTCAACRSAGADGTLTFKTIFPAAYQGRWPHVHFEVYESLDARGRAARASCARHSSPSRRTTCEAVYATAGYEQSVQNLAAPRWTPTWSSATATRASSRP